ncbi:MAG TPA: PQQ-binding-like beta-propeller repeat protein, partial [Trueperaceae bacterium]
VPGENYTLFEVGGFDRGSPQGILYAVNPATGKKAWKVEFENVRNNRPLLTTGGNLLFMGSQLGSFDAYNASTGEKVWSFRAGAGFRNSAITYLGPDGKQYLAIIASSAPSPQQVAADAPPTAEGRYSRAGSTLYVFTLPKAAPANADAQ